MASSWLVSYRQIRVPAENSKAVSGALGGVAAARVPLLEITIAGRGRLRLL